MFAGAHLHMCLSVAERQPGSVQVPMCLDVCALCSQMCVSSGLWMTLTSSLYILYIRVCVYVYTQVHAHRGELKERKFWTSFQSDIIQLLHEMSASPKSFNGPLLSSQLGAILLSVSTHMDEGQAQCLALLAFTTASRGRWYSLSYR